MIWTAREVRVVPAGCRDLSGALADIHNAGLSVPAGACPGMGSVLSMTAEGTTASFCGRRVLTGFPNGCFAAIAGDRRNCWETA